MATEDFNPEKLPVAELENLHSLYQNAYGHLQPAKLASVVAPQKLHRINAINAAYLRRSTKLIQQHFKF